MVLTDDERKIVCTFLVKQLIALGQPPHGFLAPYLGDDAMVLLADIPYAGTPNELAKKIVDACEESGETFDPRAIYRLLLLGKALLEIAPILQRIAALPKVAAAPAVGDPFGDLLLAGNLPFLDDKGKAIIVVSGPSKSGKSYSGELINHIGRALPGLTPAKVSLGEETGALTGPFEAAKSIALAMRVSEEPVIDASEKAPLRRAQLYADWVLAKRAETGKKWWIVLDGFDDPDLPEMTHAFVQHLALGVTDQAIKGQVFLLLLGYPKERVPAAVLPFVIPEELSRDAIGEVDVTEYFRTVLERAQRAYDAAALKYASKYALATLPDGSDRLPALAKKIDEVRVGLVG
jgi:hypothetical protein